MKLTCLLLGIAIGAGLYAGWHKLIDRAVAADGILQEEPTQHPAISPSYPPGFFIESRIYISDVDTNLLGKRISVHGHLRSISHPETPTYPLIEK